MQLCHEHRQKMARVICHGHGGPGISLNCLRIHKGPIVLFLKAAQLHERRRIEKVEGPAWNLFVQAPLRSGSQCFWIKGKLTRCLHIARNQLNLIDLGCVIQRRQPLVDIFRAGGTLPCRTKVERQDNSHKTDNHDRPASTSDRISPSTTELAQPPTNHSSKHEDQGNKPRADQTVPSKCIWHTQLQRDPHQPVHGYRCPLRHFLARGQTGTGQGSIDPQEDQSRKTDQQGQRICRGMKQHPHNADHHDQARQPVATPPGLGVIPRSDLVLALSQLLASKHSPQSERQGE